MVETPDGQVFLTVQAPPVRIVVTGAVHISQALAPMARLLGHDVIVVDPRTAFATPERFPDVQLYAEWPDDVLPTLGVDRYTAFVALTHDPKIDDPALHAGAALGLLLHRRARVAEDARQPGGAAEGRRISMMPLLSTISAPIGLPIGAISPAEIALSIMGEITAALRLGPGQSKAASRAPDTLATA